MRGGVDRHVIIEQLRKQENGRAENYGDSRISIVRRGVIKKSYTFF
jgi:hypothetical protein